MIKNHRTKLIDGDKIGILWKINKNKNELSSSLHIYLGWTFNILIDESKINYLQKNNSFIQLYFTNRFPKIYLNKKNYNSLKKLKDYNEKKRKSGDNEMKSNEENLNSKKNKSSNFLKVILYYSFNFKKIIYKKETSIEKEKLKNFQEEINLVNNFSNSISNKFTIINKIKKKNLENDLKISFSKNQPEDDRRRKLWTPEEDDKLKNLVIKYKPSTHEDWGLIANELGRTIKSVKHKYNDYKLYKLNI